MTTAAVFLGGVLSGVALMTGIGVGTLLWLVRGQRRESERQP